MMGTSMESLHLPAEVCKACPNSRRRMDVDRIYRGSIRTVLAIYGHLVLVRHLAHSTTSTYSGLD